MKQSLKIGLVALVVAAFAASGMAFAQSNDETVPPAGDAPAEEFAPERDGRRGPGGHHGKRGPGHVAQVAEILGIDDPQEIVDALEDGQTLAEVATANGSSGTALVDALVADLSEKLDEAMANERITQERADEILTNAEEKITELVNSTQEEIQAAREAEREARQAEREERRAERQATVASVVGIPFEDIRAALEEGSTLADVAAAQGVGLDDLVAGLTAPIAADLQEKVADGTLTQQQADERLSEMTERITERVQTVPGEGERGRRGHRGGPGFGERGGFGGGPGLGGPPADVEAAVSA